MIELIASQEGVFIVLSLLMGLIVGSFLNVVIVRLPVMLERDWQQQCQELLSGNTAELPQGSGERLNLIYPASHCPQCQAAIKPWHNIPVFSYLLLRGRCNTCSEHISLRYPLVELISGVACVIAALEFGFGYPALMAMVLSWTLIALSFIDFDKLILPDAIVLPALWLGLLLSLSSVFVSPSESIIGAAAGYGFLWLLFHIFRLLTGKEGMGHGDFKLLALLGAWLGWTMLPLILIIASVAGATIGIGLILLRKHDHQIPIPFGPYLALAGWISLLWGHELLLAYLQFANLSPAAVN